MKLGKFGSLVAAVSAALVFTHVHGAVIDEFPDHFVEWLGATGSQQIDTGYVFKTDPRVETTMMLTSGGDKDIMGTSAANDSCFIIDYKDSVKTIYYRYHASGSTQVKYAESIVNKWVDVSFGSSISYDGNKLYVTPTADFSANTSSFYLFYARTGMDGLKFKRVKMYDGGELVRDFWPAVMADGTACMYDTVTEKCYTNNKTGSFSVGDTVPGFKQSCGVTISEQNCTVSGASSGIYAGGSVITVTATPADGALFSCWKGAPKGHTTDNPLTMRIENDLDLQAVCITPSTYSAALSVDGYTGSSTLQGFPVLVRLSEANINGFSYSQCAADGSDVLFTSPDGATVYPHEIDSWNPDGVSTVWVRLPEMKKGTAFKVQWGDAAAATTADVWGSAEGGSYVGVWHLNGDVGDDEPDSVKRNSSVDLTAVVTGLTGAVPEQAYSAAAWTGRSRHFNAAYVNGGNYFKAPSFKSVFDGNTYSVSLWINSVAVSGTTWCYHLANHANASGSSGWSVKGITAAKPQQQYWLYSNGSNTGTGYFTPAKEWVHMVCTCEGKVQSIYVDGVLVKQATVGDNGNIQDVPLLLGIEQENDGKPAFGGSYDELRFLGGAAVSADWVKAEYDTVATDGFLVYSDAKQSGANALTITAVPEELGKVDPEYGLHTDMPVDGEYLCKVENDTIVYSETHRGVFTGWKLYQMDDTGIYQLKNEDDTLTYAHYQEKGVTYKLVWQIADMYLVDIASSSHGMVNATPEFYQDGSEIILTATPDADSAFIGWSGVPDGKKMENPLELTVNGAMRVVANFATTDGKRDLDLSQGDQTVSIDAGEVCTVEKVIGNPAATLTVTGGGTLILPEGDDSSAFKNLVLDGVHLIVASEAQIGSGTVTLANGATISFTASLALGKVYSIASGDTGVIDIPEDVTISHADKTNRLTFPGGTLVKTGAGTLSYTQNEKNANGSFLVRAGVVNIACSMDGGQLPALEIDEGALVTYGQNVFKSTFSTITLRGGTFEYSQLHRNLTQNSRNLIDQGLVHEQMTISKIAAYPSASGTPSSFRSERFQGAIEFFVDEGAVLDVDCLFRADGRVRNSYVKTGAGELRFHKAPYTGTLFTHREGTITFACPTAGFDREMSFSVAPGAVIRAADGSVLYQTVDPVNALLAEAGVWIDIPRSKGTDGVQFGSAGGVPNFGSAGGALIHQSPASCPVFVANGINGLPALDFRYADAGNGVRLVGNYQNTGAELSVYVVAQSPDFTAADAQHGKDASPVSCASASGTSSAKGGFRFYLSAADSLNVAFNGEDNSKALFENVHPLTDTPYLMVAERTPTTGRFRQYVGDGSETYEGMVDGQNWGNCNIQNVGIGSAIKKDCGTWDAGGQFVGKIGEVLIFSRVLTDEEDAAVRGYLAKKWFNSTAEWAALPEGERTMTVDVPEGETSVLALETKAGDAPVTLVKTGAGDIRSASAYESPFFADVRDGRFCLTKGFRNLSVAAIWLDPSDPSTLTHDAGGAATLAAVANKGYLGGAFVPYSADASTHPTVGNVNGNATLFFDGTDILRYRGWTNAIPREACIFVAKRRTAYQWGGAVLSYTREASEKKDEQSPGAIVMEDGDNSSKFSVKLGAVGIDTTKETAGSDVVAIDYLTLSPHTGMLIEMRPDHTPTNCPVNVHSTDTSDDDRATQNDLLQLGCRIKAGGEPDRDHWTGDIAELIILERQPSRSVTLEILEYLQKKWQGVGPGSATPPRFLSGNRASNTGRENLSILGNPGTVILVR